jgi:hypothetical protein
LVASLFQIDDNVSFNWNGDSYSDLIVTNGESNNILVLLGNGNGSLVFQVSTDPSSLAVGDFNGDGKLDLVAATKNFREFPVLSLSFRFLTRSVLSILDTIWPHEFGVNPSVETVFNWHTCRQ